MASKAEQEARVRRSVAAKVIKPGMDGKHVIARLKGELQALALMAQPNVAHVFDAGARKSLRQRKSDYAAGEHATKSSTVGFA